jgi:hypothetical protein
MDGVARGTKDVPHEEFFQALLAHGKFVDLGLRGTGRCRCDPDADTLTRRSPFSENEREPV